MADSFNVGGTRGRGRGWDPRQHTSGGKQRMLGISKRGDSYLRWLFIHVGLSMLRAAKGKRDPRSRCACRLAERRPANVVAVAIANKNARIAWALLTRKARYHHLKLA